MDLDYSAQEIAFRDDVCAFLASHLPADISARVADGSPLGRDDTLRWQAILHARGWLASVWPREHGGTGWSVVERHIFAEEAALHSAPRLPPFGLNMLGPVVIRYGTDAQKTTILPRILDGTDWWCQGYSEPGAGSDLASLRTRAIRDGDHYVVNGQKTWTTYGQYANKIFCLVRTADGKPQQGISFLLVDLDTPGVEMRPIRIIDGSTEVNEVFFTDARVPVANLVGDENAGWTIAKYLLTYERTNIAGVGYATKELARLRQLSCQTVRDGRRIAENPAFAARMAELECELEALRVTNLRLLADARDGAASNVDSSMLKLRGTQLRQALHEISRMVLGPMAGPLAGTGRADDLDLPPDAIRAAQIYFNHRKLSIYGGSNEIQRNIVAQHLFRG